MTKTLCDICGKEMPMKIIEPLRNYNFCISTHGRAWDICNECREDLNKWIISQKNKKEIEG